LIDWRESEGWLWDTWSTPIELASAGITLGKTYPQRIVDHAKPRQRALAADASIRKG
jgi:deoxyribodipyrimidine photo-lyase